MAKTNYKTIDEYQNAFSQEVRERLQQIRMTVREVVPEAEETISFQIPAFKYKGYLIYYSAYIMHISLASPWSDLFLKEFEPELKNLRVSKSAIQFPNKEELPLDLIRRIIEFRKKENETQK